MSENGLTLAVMQPYLFPYLGYFQLIDAADRFIFYDDVAFIKQGWIARNRILVGGKAHLFSVPVRDASSFRTIRETALHDHQYPVWRAKFLKTLEMNYRKAPHFDEAFRLVAEVVAGMPASVGELAIQSVKAVCKYLEMPFTPGVSADLPGGIEGSGQDRILGICRALGAQRYVNLPGGRELYSREEFAKQGIDLKFVQPGMSPYDPQGSEFVPALSIIDVLMFNSKSSCQRLLRDYDYFSDERK